MYGNQELHILLTVYVGVWGGGGEGYEKRVGGTDRGLTLWWLRDIIFCTWLQTT